MSFNADDEILQDFLVEAGEIIDTLNEEMVELEQRPEDADLLNSVFRSFHTIKGGAGFLGLEPLVELCHRAEDVFNLLRNGELHVNARIMDVMLPVLDSLNEMFDNLRAGTEPEDADPAQLAALDAIIKGEEAPAPAPPPTEEPAAAEQASSENEDITDEEFEHLLDALDDENADQPPAENNDDDGFIDLSNDSNDGFMDLSGDNGQGDDLFDIGAGESATEPESDEITEEEFDELLDQLHGKGQFNASNIDSPVSEAGATEPKQTPSEKKEEKPLADDEISDSEFEDLLDELHGKGKFVGVPGEENNASTDAKEDVKEGELQKASEVVPEPKNENIEEPQTVPEAETNAAAAAEAKPTAVKPKPAKKNEVPSVQSETTVRVDTKRLDDIMNMVGELVLVRNRLVTLEHKIADDDMSKAVSSLDVVTSDLQMSVMKTRMQPIKKVFGRFPRVVRDISRSMKKEVKLVLVGEETDLDKNLVEALADPLVHLVRNAVDHGVESPEEREKSGKSRQGTVTLSAEQEGDHILLSIEDDGSGMDPESLRRKVVEKGLMDEETAARLDRGECFNLIFLPGLSTKDVISDVSGRGVGMDVVKTRIAQLNGAVEIESELGVGTVIAIKVPLTLAIMPTLMVKLKDQAFALPLVSVNEIFHLDLTKTNTVDGQMVIMVRNKPLPLFYLTRWLVKGAEYDELPEQGHVVVVHVGTKKVGFVVNHLIGQEEVVIKPLGALLQGTDGLAGATITGDGKIALIVDIPSLMVSRVR